MPDPALLDAVEVFAAHPSVLVATDFDGALAPLVLDPADSRPLEGGMEALTALADLPRTTVALVSGRDLAALRELSGAAEPLVLVGSHGAEDSRRPDGLVLSQEQRDLLATLETDLREVTEAHPGSRIEDKPAGRVLHTRGIDPQVGAAALDAAAALGERHTALVVTPGKEVVELAVAHVGKGTALVALAEELGVDAVFYAGDDVTDEQGFEALAQDPDAARAARRLTVRVGDGETAAQFRVADEPGLVGVLRAVLQARARSSAGG
ncbi:trehalose-phosphatase [Ornithinimicrobium avium]|uniref:Trehalose 6-phosphate phosphatase n=1 Tax=Ornithinimicrobium avium TaxID=2283195 RepID=A0A345NQQ8_9MICO|nr:trehalose-phosphatase [Ornithinimicrobium avium]AXH97366.1 trehalose-phosphatase [Ornithinimicrobium avium]